MKNRTLALDAQNLFRLTDRQLLSALAEALRASAADDTLPPSAVVIRRRDALALAERLGDVRLAPERPRRSRNPTAAGR